jgi:hypothetical protein
MSVDKCRPVVIDGEVIRVHGGAEMTPDEVEMFAEIVRAAKRKLAADDGYPIQTAMFDERAKYEPEPRSCPDCEQGKHGNCTGEAWDNDADAPVPCPCQMAGHP